LQAIYRRARRAGLVPTNPTADLELPSSGRRERAATPSQTAELLGVLPELERAVWGMAFYAGLRRGELQALRVQDVDFEQSVIRVERGWDPVEGPIAPKSRAGTRTVFLLETLRPLLEAVAAHDDSEGLFFGSTAVSAFEPRNIERKARRAWKAENDRRTEKELPAVEWFGLHEARHSFSTFLDHAGVSETRANRMMGHSDGTVAGRYRHLLPGQLTEDAKRLDAYLEGAGSGKVVGIHRAAAG
jgi:integrase